MTSRNIHRMSLMYAVHSGNHVLAITANQLSALIDKYLPHLDEFERISIKMAHSPDFGAFGSRDHANSYPQWERTLISRLQADIGNSADLVSFNFQTADAIRYLPDILEAYRGNHIGEFSWSLDEPLDDQGQTTVTVQTYDPPGFFDKLVQRTREPRSRHLFKLSGVKHLAGTAMNFIVYCNGFAIAFSRSGNVVRT
ncbi:hypothetical protein [Comamonas sp.]|uniref:hypothetical protein n=1 Tax=Comamonas sp. TaxID=34028 RepID=UPI0028B0704C|nr:hypothetical protein [Comamonas sp.]